ncbi:MAG: hypothetical protein DME31_07655 [Verrucomicrobia bacterium]|nr:MAG: hypothetical protein DMC59_06270 [Verrucomicrobiota bacterium]PYL03046.1 MAG: hypothetical protein DME31_07655 [Verrucomicrobiota bacterium]PYL30768.1 MAG: hypothetical protein DMF39_04550 [Verrucomicrobiota bacterium]
MMLTRLAVGLEPLNALDAAHRSPRSNSLSRAEFGSPVGPATRRSIKRNKELPKHLVESIHSQARHWPRKSLPVNERAMEILRQ